MSKATKLMAMAAACGLAGWLGGCCCDECKDKEGEKTAAVTATPVNKVCPVGHGPVNSAVTVAYKDKTVGFCCPGCVPKWEKASDAEKARMLSAADTNK